MRDVVVLCLLVVLAACASSVAGPTISMRGTPGPEEEFIGVVNGLWRYDRDENRTRLERDRERFDEAQIEELSGRYLVRVGIERGVFRGLFSEYAVLPEGWTYSQAEVVNDGRTVNVGDVVTLRGTRQSLVDQVVAIRRKCDMPPVSGERREWNIGCVAINVFEEPWGYGGKYYPLAVF